MNSPMIESVHIQGFRSLADFRLSELKGATVLIGANGSGKSNFIRFFEILSWMLGTRRLGEFVARHGGADDQLYGGNGVSQRIKSNVRVRTDKGRYDYRFALSYSDPDRFFFSDERFRFTVNDCDEAVAWQYLDSGHREAMIVEAAQSADFHRVNKGVASAIVNALRGCAAYQFHDTSDTSNFKKSWDVSDNNRLRSDGGNLAAILYRIEREDIRRYELICRQISRVLPGFDRFAIEEIYGKALLRWKAKGVDKTFGAHLTSDGSLRFFALVTLLNLPPTMLPNVLLLDEPELGLHPAAVTLVGGMIKSLSERRQVIVATQSPLMVDAFDLSEVFALELRDGRSEIRRFDPESYQAWLDEGFTAGQLWQKNLLGGRP